ncbi:MAG: hypothetical protein KKG96_03400, partial [Proteobacteria bacterium]|nr:hypothetical protein [Pseudomonadota bacterium]
LALAGHRHGQIPDFNLLGSDQQRCLHEVSFPEDSRTFFILSPLTGAIAAGGDGSPRWSAGIAGSFR